MKFFFVLLILGMGVVVGFNTTGENLSQDVDISSAKAGTKEANDNKLTKTDDALSVDYKTVDFETLANLAVTGDTKAQEFLGFRFYKNETFEKLLVIAEKGDAEAQRWIGFKYARGEGVKYNILKAEEWYLKAAKQGNAGAQDVLGGLYLRGEMPDDGWGVPKDPEKGMEWKRKAIEQGYAPAVFNFGWAHLFGNEFVKADPEKGMEIIFGLAEKNDIRALTFLGNSYLNGVSNAYGDKMIVPKNRDEAIYWFEKLAATGDTHAQKQLNRLKGIQTPVVKITKEKDQKDFKSLYKMHMGIMVEELDCRRHSGHTRDECKCAMADDYEDMRGILEKIIKNHPDWLGQTLHYKNGGHSVSTSLESKQKALKHFDKKCRK